MILVFGGTSDSLAICDYLNQNNKNYIVSVTTQYGMELTKNKTDNVVVGKMTYENMCDFIKENKITTIIDATHPYAIEVSKNAIQSSQTMKIKYKRFERKSLIEDIDYKNLFLVDDLDGACELANKIGKNIFLATGSNTLKQYAKNLKDKNIIARVLPTSDVLKICEDAGLNADNIIGIKGPFSESINEEMYKHYDIDLVITKESGHAGGFMEKINPCKRLNINVIVIKRNIIDYPNVVEDIINILD